MPLQIRCPSCNKRLLDVQKESTGEIAIKCPQCKRVSYIELKKLIVK